MTLQISYRVIDGGSGKLGTIGLPYCDYVAPMDPGGDIIAQTDIALWEETR